MGTAMLLDSLPAIIERLVEYLSPEQIILFGSYVNGTPTEDSDLDLLVIVSTSDEPGYRRARRAYQALRGIAAPTDVIVLTRQEVNEKMYVPGSLVSQVVHHGRVVYGQREAG